MEVTFSALVRFQNLKGIAATKKKKKQNGGVEFAPFFFSLFSILVLIHELKFHY